MAPRSRTARWAAAVAGARTAFELLQEKLEQVGEIQEEYEEWQSNLPENMQSTATAEKLDAVVELDLEATGDVETMLEELENAELPVGFGRD